MGIHNVFLLESDAPGGGSTYEIPIMMRTKKFRAELNREYGQMIEDTQLFVWSALNKAVVRDGSVSDIVMKAKSSS